MSGSNGGGGGLVLVESGVFSAVASVAIEAGFSDAFEDYFLAMSDLQTSSAYPNVGITLKSKGGAYLATGYYSSGLYNSGAVFYSQGDNVNAAQFSIVNFGSSTVGLGSADIDILGAATVGPTSLYARAMSGSGAAVFFQTLQGDLVSNNAIDGIKFVPSAGVISGAYRLYGMEK